VENYCSTFAVDITTLTFNDGLMSFAKVLEVMGVKIRPNCNNFCTESDATPRIAKAERSMSDQAKDARRANLAARREENKADLNVEGQLYGAGITD